MGVKSKYTPCSCVQPEIQCKGDAAGGLYKMHDAQGSFHTHSRADRRKQCWNSCCTWSSIAGQWKTERQTDNSSSATRAGFWFCLEPVGVSNRDCLSICLFSTVQPCSSPCSNCSNSGQKECKRIDAIATRCKMHRQTTEKELLLQGDSVTRHTKVAVKNTMRQRS